MEDFENLFEGEAKNFSHSTFEFKINPYKGAIVTMIRMSGTERERVEFTNIFEPWAWHK